MQLTNLKFIFKFQMMTGGHVVCVTKSSRSPLTLTFVRIPIFDKIRNEKIVSTNGHLVCFCLFFPGIHLHNEKSWEAEFRNHVWIAPVHHPALSILAFFSFWRGLFIFLFNRIMYYLLPYFVWGLLSLFRRQSSDREKFEQTNKEKLFYTETIKWKKKTDSSISSGRPARSFPIVSHIE